MNIQLLPPKVSCQICSIFQLYPAIKDMHPIRILASIADMYHIQVLWLLWGLCASLLKIQLKILCFLLHVILINKGV